jgi:hypothetical protein
MLRVSSPIYIPGGQKGSQFDHNLFAALFFKSSVCCFSLSLGQQRDYGKMLLDFDENFAGINPWASRLLPQDWGLDLFEVLKGRVYGL